MAKCGGVYIKEDYFSSQEIAKMTPRMKEHIATGERDFPDFISQFVSAVREILNDPKKLQESYECDENCLLVQQYLNEFSLLSGNQYHLRNLNLLGNGLTIANLKNQENNTGKSPYKALRDAMREAGSNLATTKDASFNSHYYFASLVVLNFDEIKYDLFPIIGYDINLDESNIVAQLLALVVKHQNDPNHKINQCIPEKILVPC
jgi:hypothetical protein